MAILTKSGRSAIAQSIKNQQIHLAWGEGSESLEKTAESVESPLSDNLSEDILATGLVKETGRRLADEVLFVEGDDDGNLITPTGRFREVDYPTNNLYLRFTFDFCDASNKTIRELGVFIGTKTKSDLPNGQRYFEINEITDPGILLLLEKTVPLIRTAATRESFSFVITF